MWTVNQSMQIHAFLYQLKMAAPILLVTVAIFSLSTLRYFIPHFVKKITRILFQDSQLEESLKSQIKQLGEEQSEMNVKEEFPKYARIDRKMNKLKEELKKLRQGKTAKSFTFSWGLTLILNLLQTTCFVVLIWRYRYEAMVILDEAWLWPMAHLIAFPSGIPGAVGITCWILISNNILRRGEALVKTVRSQCSQGPSQKT